MRLLIATSNPGKASEYRAALEPCGFELSSLADFPPLAEPQETESTFRGNARLKADYYFEQLAVPCLADDSGLEVDALGGRPGVRSARVADSDRQRIAVLLSWIHEAEAQRGTLPRTARFVCAICLRLPEGRIEVEGTVQGQIIDTPRGSRGFGYDPIFYYPPRRKTFAELSPSEKNRLSHRAQALRRLLAKIQTSRQAANPRRPEKKRKGSQSEASRSSLRLCNLA